LIETINILIFEALEVFDKVYEINKENFILNKEYFSIYKKYKLKLTTDLKGIEKSIVDKYLIKCNEEDLKHLKFSYNIINKRLNSSYYNSNNLNDYCIDFKEY